MLEVGRLIGAYGIGSEIPMDTTYISETLGQKNLQVQFGTVEYKHQGIVSVAYDELVSIADGVWQVVKTSNRNDLGSITIQSLDTVYHLSAPDTVVDDSDMYTENVWISSTTPKDLSADKYQNQNRSREDRYVIAEYTIQYATSKSTGSINYKLIGVFDGHGGSSVADTCVSEFPNHLGTYLKPVILHEHSLASDQDAINALTRAVTDFDAYLFTKHGTETAGSCFCGALWRPGMCDKIYLINLGDSRAIVHYSNGILIEETLDLKPDLEEDRIKSSGGWVGRDIFGTYRVNGMLAVARAFGDFSLKKGRDGQYTPYGPVSAVPAISIVELDKLNSNYVQITIASDGIFDALETQQLLDMLASKQSSSQIRRTVKDETNDDLTLITVNVTD